jgi:hypothetical protein
VNDLDAIDTGPSLPMFNRNDVGEVESPIL